jgi:hypothetical protein
VSEDQAKANTEFHVTMAESAGDADDRIAARLKQLLGTPGISDKDRKQVERNLKRLLEAQALRKKQSESLGEK